MGKRMHSICSTFELRKRSNDGQSFMMMRKWSLGNIGEKKSPNKNSLLFPNFQRILCQLITRRDQGSEWMLFLAFLRWSSKKSSFREDIIRKLFPNYPNKISLLEIWDASSRYTNPFLRSPLYFWNSRTLPLNLRHPNAFCNSHESSGRKWVGRWWY